PLALVAQQQQSHHPHTHPNHFNQNSSRTHQSATRKREKAVVNSPQLIYDQEPFMVDDDNEDTECQKPKRAKDEAYHREKMLLCKQEEAGIQLNAEQADWRDDTDDESDDQELEAHYMYMAKLQQVSPDVDDSGPIFDKEPEQKVQNDDDYDVFSIDCQHSEQSESVHNTYLTEQDA
nr:hypothetical protein [Tanacetum cinerariifolium]